MHDDLEEVPSRSLEEYWGIARRRRWWILLPMFVCWALVWAVGWLLPTTYTSEAEVLIQQQQVSQQYVAPNVTVSLQDRLQSMTQQILSRTRLQATIDHYGLYAKSHSPMALLDSGDPVEQMRKDINIELVASPDHPDELTSFKIDYTARSRELAQQVNNDLTSMFINVNLESQQQESENTTSFFASQLASARSQLEDQEAKVRAFKAQHLGDLPDQLQTNVQVLTGLQAQLDTDQRTLDSAKQQKLYLESQLQQYQAAQGDGGNGSGDASATTPDALAKELQDLRTQLADARTRYTEDFPDVVALKQKIKEVQDDIAAAQKAAKAASPTDTASADDATYASSPQVIQLRSQLKSIEFEIQNDQHHLSAIQSQIGSYRARLNMSPETEQGLADVSRGYDEAKANYDSLLQKQNQSQLATNLEQGQQGEQFRIIDPPSLPDKPASPNHLQISLIGVAMGIGIGLGLAAVLELTNARVWREKDLEGLVPGMVLVGIPHLGTQGEEHHRAAFPWLELGAAVGMIILIMAGNLYAFYKG
jgi:polysaccharide chain length determinant protein (PEP-CTERM system associated)